MALDGELQLNQSLTLIERHALLEEIYIQLAQFPIPPSIKLNDLPDDVLSAPELSMHDPVPLLPRFTGVHPNKWIAYAERYFTYYRIHNTERYPYVLNHFYDEAAMWLTFYQFTEWSDFIVSLVQQFGYSRNALQVFDEMSDSIETKTISAIHETIDDKVMEIQIDSIVDGNESLGVKDAQMDNLDYNIVLQSVVESSLIKGEKLKVFDMVARVIADFEWKPGWRFGFVVHPTGTAMLNQPSIIAGSANYVLHKPTSLILLPNQLDTHSEKRDTLELGFGTHKSLANFGFDPGSLVNTPYSTRVTSLIDPIELALLVSRVSFLDLMPIDFAQSMHNASFLFNNGIHTFDFTFGVGTNTTDLNSVHIPIQTNAHEHLFKFQARDTRLTWEGGTSALFYYHVAQVHQQLQLPAILLLSSPSKYVKEATSHALDVMKPAAFLYNEILSSKNYTSRSLECIQVPVYPNYVHRDINPSNLLLDSTFKTNMSNFGLQINGVFSGNVILEIHIFHFLSTESVETKGCKAECLSEVMKLSESGALSFDLETTSLNNTVKIVRKLSESVEPTIVRLIIVFDYPVEISLLAKLHSWYASLTMRVKLLKCGCAIGNTFSKLTAPLDQRRWLGKQVQHHNPTRAAAILSGSDTKGVVDVSYTLPLNRDFSTVLNHQSNWFHCIVMVQVCGKVVHGGSPCHCHYLVEIIGNEQEGMAEMTNIRFNDTSYMQKFLSCFGDEITTLLHLDSCIPYKNKKVPQLFQNTLGGAYYFRNPKITSFEALYGHKPLTKTRYPHRFRNLHLEDKVYLKGGSNVMTSASGPTLPAQTRTSGPILPAHVKKPNDLIGLWKPSQDIYA